MDAAEYENFVAICLYVASICGFAGVFVVNRVMDVAKLVETVLNRLWRGSAGSAFGHHARALAKLVPLRLIGLSLSGFAGTFCLLEIRRIAEARGSIWLHAIKSFVVLVYVSLSIPLFMLQAGEIVPFYLSLIGL
jgi:hypothetical protein